MADIHKNAAYSTVATAPSPASSGLSLVVQAGDGAKFPAPGSGAGFNATVWPANALPLTSNMEIVRVTNVSTDTFTIVRQQEGSSARSIGTGDQIAATVTAKTLTDAEQLGMATGPNFIESGCTWTPDSAGSTRVATMATGYCWIAGVRLYVPAVTSRTFTASKDTYVDFQNNGDGTASITYSEVTNNATSPALGNSGSTATTIRNAIVVTGASSIADQAHINMGDPASLVPIASSIPYCVTDSLGNLIFPTNSQYSGMIGYRQNLNGYTVVNSTAITDITGISVPFIIPPGLNRKIKATLYIGHLFYNNTGAGHLYIRNGSTVLQTTVWDMVVASHYLSPKNLVYEALLAAGSYTYKGSTDNPDNSHTLTLGSSSTEPLFLSVEYD